jgi:hypothetical protein
MGQTINVAARAASALGVLIGVSLAMPAVAMPVSFTDASFLSVAAGDRVQFTFIGFDAADTDQLQIDGQTVFTNQTASVGQVFETGPLSAGTHQLSLVNLTSNLTYSSASSLNPDGAHLGTGTTLADFNLSGALPPNLGSSLLYGWEDRPLDVTRTLDFNDLVFAIRIIPAASIPEPGTVALLGGSLVMLGGWRWRRARRRHGVAR